MHGKLNKENHIIGLVSFHRNVQINTIHPVPPFSSCSFLSFSLRIDIVLSQQSLMSTQLSPLIDRSQPIKRKFSSLDAQNGDENGHASPSPPVDAASLPRTHLSPLSTDHHAHNHHNRRQPADIIEPREETNSNSEPVPVSSSKSKSNYCYRHDPINSRCYRQMDQKATDDLHRVCEPAVF